MIDRTRLVARLRSYYSFAVACGLDEATNWTEFSRALSVKIETAGGTVGWTSDDCLEYRSSPTARPRSPVLSVVRRLRVQRSKGESRAILVKAECTLRHAAFYALGAVVMTVFITAFFLFNAKPDMRWVAGLAPPVSLIFFGVLPIVALPLAYRMAVLHFIAALGAHKT